MSATSDNSGHMAPLRSAQIQSSDWASHVCKTLYEMTNSKRER